MWLRAGGLAVHVHYKGKKKKQGFDSRQAFLLFSSKFLFSGVENVNSEQQKEPMNLSDDN